VPVKLESEIADHMQCVRQESGLVSHREPGESWLGPDDCAASSPAAEMESEANSVEEAVCVLKPSQADRALVWTNKLVGHNRLPPEVPKTSSGEACMLDEAAQCIIAMSDRDVTFSAAETGDIVVEQQPPQPIIDDISPSSEKPSTPAILSPSSLLDLLELEMAASWVDRTCAAGVSSNT
jgi:hypothetical protein